MGSHAALIWEEVKEDVSVKQQMVESAVNHHADVLVVGMHGRKGPKEDHTILGSAV
jgi:nucleotide-binding universal stress UspA family protein